MSELNFPKNPAVGQEYTFNSLLYMFDGVKWVTKGTGYNPVQDLYEVLASDAGASFVGANGYDNVQAALDANADFVSRFDRESLRRSYAEAGYNLVDGSFEEGGILTSASDVLLHKTTAAAYAWSGAFPKVVNAGSTPATSGGIGAGAWVDRTDVTLRGDINVVVKVFESVADMKADATLIVGQKCRTLGYYAVGDGGGNDYIIVAAATGTDDGGSYIDLSGSGFQAKGLFGVYINVKQFGAKGDGVTDDAQKIQKAIDFSSKSIVKMPAGTYIVNSSIKLGNQKSLVGESELDISSLTFTNSTHGTRIKYNGTTSSTAAVIMITSATNVGDSPTSDTNAILKNISIHCNAKAGFGVYGVRCMGSIIKNVYVVASTEYNFYFAWMWYGVIEDIRSNYCRRNGIAFGMPLILSDNTNLSSGWTYTEMNSIKISNIISGASGMYYVEDAPGTYSINDSDSVMKGYGIGFGKAHGITLRDIHSSGTGGAGLYIYNYTSNSPYNSNKVVDGAYFENAGVGTATPDDGNNPTIIIESETSTLPYYTGLEIKNVYNGGAKTGKFYVRSNPCIMYVENVQFATNYPQITGISPLTRDDVYKHTTFNNVHRFFASKNYRSPWTIVHTFQVDSGTEWSDVDLTPYAKTELPIFLFARKVSGGIPSAGTRLVYDGGGTSAFAFPSDLPSTFVELTESTVINIGKLTSAQKWFTSSKDPCIIEIQVRTADLVSPPKIL